MITYNKIVRDKIPEIIENDGRKPIISILSKEKYYKALVDKLIEETNEFIESDSLEELADVLEVIEALIKTKGISWDDLFKIKDSKREARGGFEKKILLEEVIE